MGDNPEVRAYLAKGRLLFSDLGDTSWDLGRAIVMERSLLRDSLSADQLDYCNRVEDSESFG